MAIEDITVRVRDREGQLLPQTVSAEIYGRWAVHDAIPLPGRARQIGAFSVTYIPTGLRVPLMFNRNQARSIAKQLATAYVESVWSDAAKEIVRRVVLNITGLDVKDVV